MKSSESDERSEEGFAFHFKNIFILTLMNRLMVKKGLKVSLVIPVYNEAKVIEEVIRDCHKKIISKLPGSEFIISEDGSNDGTKEILKKLEKELNLRLVMGDERKGYPKSIRDALQLPKNELVLFSDSDGQHEPDDFWKLLEKTGKCDIVIGHKLKRNDPFHRLIFSRGYNFLVGLLLGLWLKDVDSGFRIYKKKVLKDVLKKSATLKECTNSEITIRAFKKGYKVCEVPVKHYARKYGETKSFKASKLAKVIYELFTGLLRLRSELNK